MLDGTASSQIIAHYLKIGTTRESIEKEILQKQKGLIDAKTQAVTASMNHEERFLEALEAIRQYSGQGGSDVED